MQHPQSDTNKFKLRALRLEGPPPDRLFPEKYIANVKQKKG